MCGIIYTKRRDGQNAVKSLIKRYKKQEHRGQEGYGYLPIYGEKIGNIKRTKSFLEIESYLENEISSEILFHHRTPTSTENYEGVTHPIIVKNNSLKYNYYVVHNGMIRNDAELQSEFEELGFNYSTIIETIEIIRIQGKDVEENISEGHNDSESFAIDLALFLENKQDEIKSIGTISFICVQTNKEDKPLKLFYGHNDGNPLIKEENGDLFFLKSEGGGQKLEEDVLFEYDYLTMETTERKVNIGKTYFYTTTTVSSSKSYGYDTHINNRMQLIDSSQRKSEEYDYNNTILDDIYNHGGSIESPYFSSTNYNNLIDDICELESQLAYYKETVDSSPNSNSNDFLFNTEMVKELTSKIDDKQKELEKFDNPDDTGGSINNLFP